MTRESKLALIVGFGLVLFVGILVSDHFSSGQRQEAAHLLAQRGALRGAAAPISIQPLVPDAAPESAKASLAKGNDAGGGAAVKESAPASTNTPSNGERANATPSGGVSSPAGPASPSSPANPNNPASPTTPGSDRRGNGELVIGGPSPSRTGAPNGTAPGEPAVAAKLYPVKDGETLYSICAAQYGDGSLWKALADFNKSAVPNPARMRKGVTLRLPPVEVLKPGAASKSGADPSAGAVARNGSTATPAPVNAPSPGAPTAPKSASPAPPSSANTYTVQQGETLSDIAKRTLGSTSRWKEVAKLNQDVIRDPNALQPGTVIRLPSQG